MLWRPPIHCAIVASNPLCYHGLQSTELWQPPIRSAILASKTMNYDGLQSTMLWQPPINCTMMTSTPKCYHGLQSTELWQHPINCAMMTSNPWNCFTGVDGDEGGEGRPSRSGVLDGAGEEVFGAVDQFSKISRNGAKDSHSAFTRGARQSRIFGTYLK